jgi:hypothetical protein
VNTVILNWQKPLCKGDQEVVKRSGRDEPMWVAVHKCMEAVLRISLYSYLYLKLAKTLCLFYYLLCFSSPKSDNKRVEQVLLEVEGGRNTAQSMYTHVSKCKK